MLRSRLAHLVTAASLLVALTLAFGAAAGAATAPVGPPTATGRGGAAATVERLATQAAIDTLRRGGNAVDAAVTAAGVLSVTEPFSSGIGGGGFLVLYDASQRKVTTIDGREVAPAAMSPASFWEDGAPLSFSDARHSGLSVGVPGTVATWARVLREYGTISLREALAPAIRVARKGFVVDQTFFDQTALNRDWFADVPAAAALYLDADGTPRDVGTVVRNPDLAATLAGIARFGPRAFYRGPLAAALIDTVRHPPVSPAATHVWRPGVMTGKDLRAYAVRERAPTHVSYRGLDVYGMGPPSSGGSTVGEALNILESYALPGMARDAVLQRMLEASRYSFADRNAYVADPSFFPVPLTGLLAEGYAATRRALITERAATSPVAPGDPYPFDAAGQAAAKETEPAKQTELASTTHISTCDRWGNVVSYTFTIEAIGGAGMVVPGYGFLVNNELTDFTFDSTTQPNRVEGGKRPRSSICPTIVLRDGAPLLTVGAPGGASIISTVLQLLVDRLDQGMTLPQAIVDPRLSQLNTATTQVEPAFLSTPEAAALQKLGYVLAATPEIGAATGIELLGHGEVLAVAEPVRRGGGSAMVVAAAAARRAH